MTNDARSGEVYDAVVVGGGPAGLSAATWLGRYRRTVLVLDAGEYRNRWTEKVHGYLGDDPVAPDELLGRARKDLGAYESAEVRRARATGVATRGDGFVVHAEGRAIEARRLILATGVQDAFPEVEGFFEHYGSTVFHCPACDGYEARGRRTIVFGWAPSITGFALLLLNWASSVTIVTDGRSFQGDREDRARLDANGVRVIEGDARRLLGRRGALRGVELHDGSVLECDMAFFAIAHRPNTAFAEALGCALTDKGYVDVDHQGATSVEGVYAAGDVTPGDHLAVVAAAQGASAGIACARSLLL